jgi:hypothetical protein
MITKADIESRARLLLEMNPSPVPRHRLLRDVLHTDPREPEFQAIVNRLDQSLHVRILLDEQRADGGWGAFHSRSTNSKQRIASTEAGVERAINLGMDKCHPSLAHVKSYILSIMEGEIPFPDYHERNDRWATGMRLFLASTLSLIDPMNKELDKDRELWREIAISTFRSGTYSERDEINIHQSLTSASVENSYLKINNRYSLNILGSKAFLLPEEVETAFLNWLWNYEGGIGYLEVSLSKIPPLIKPGILDRWFVSLEMISRLFRLSAKQIEDSIDWIWNQQNQDGLWDFGARSTSSTFMPLSVDWRVKKNRMIDWSTRVLILISQYLFAKQ